MQYRNVKPIWVAGLRWYKWEQSSDGGKTWVTKQASTDDVPAAVKKAGHVVIAQSVAWEKYGGLVILGVFGLAAWWLLKK